MDRDSFEAVIRCLPLNLPEPDLILPVPPSDNKRKALVRGRIITSYSVLQYRKEVRDIVTALSVSIALPPIVLLYKVFFHDRRRDGQNCQKVLVDAIFQEDRQVYPWCLPKGLDKEDPRCEVWFIPLERSEFRAERSNWCSDQTSRGAPAR